jgi:hypothetical protein
MAQTLDATLAAAQDSQTRHPLLEIKSSSMAPEIPFLGQDLTTESLNEEKPVSVALSSGRLSTLYVLNDRYLKYVYTDELRTVFTPVTFDIGGNPPVIDSTLARWQVATWHRLYRPVFPLLPPDVVYPRQRGGTAATTIL